MTAHIVKSTTTLISIHLMIHQTITMGIRTMILVFSEKNSGSKRCTIYSLNLTHAFKLSKVTHFIKQLAFSLIFGRLFTTKLLQM